MWNDIKKYELYGKSCHNTAALKTRVQSLA